MCGRFLYESTCTDFGCEWDGGSGTCDRRACSTYDRDEEICEYFRCKWDATASPPCDQDIPPAYVPCFTFETEDKCNERSGKCNWVASEGRCRGKMCGRFLYESTCTDFGCEWDGGSGTCDRRACFTYGQNEETCEYFRCKWDANASPPCTNPQFKPAP